MSADQVRAEVVHTIFEAMTAMDPFKVAALAGTEVTPAEVAEAEQLFIAAMVASRDYHRRQLEVWNVLIRRRWAQPPTWGQMFDELTDDDVHRLGELYDAMPDGARAEYDRRYGRPDLAAIG